ncbi:hypothetical protein [Streptomyces caniscabiei]|uniref:Uncharacterized protein n=1 Tax=Streptomyces caniscabiei TaxID=2746961 RepID=A0A927L3Q5_9ACTN|nr:hypothetical protein [Streptomyces caniscabiei]MBD9701298.1 hypothetical protein [Streptomyces caniscabiei]MBD9724458.1 hypothetical protein [Streptomyces caniscabiei]MDX3507869.1 hypothetical protein [Streptomyces caniscabiei]MDX3717831.1 hypothetical protein [Streptomyces caniscabiei]MDX3726522.1 hypothetical protein [Streptomyces caniscabiei]
MERSEIMQRVVGILTEAVEVRRQTRENPGVEVALTGAVSALLVETLPKIELPADASAQEAAHIVTEALAPAIVTLANCFSYAFVQLAEVHDAGRTDTTAADVLRALSLQLARRDGE